MMSKSIESMDFSISVFFFPPFVLKIRIGPGT